MFRKGAERMADKHTEGNIPPPPTPPIRARAKISGFAHQLIPSSALQDKANISVFVNQLTSSSALQGKACPVSLNEVIIILSWNGSLKMRSLARKKNKEDHDLHEGRLCLAM